MEKRVAHYDLDAVKAVVLRRGVDAFTQAAKDGSLLMGLPAAIAVSVVLGLQRSHFYKSMTTHTDHRTWQDVYHVPCPNRKTAYIKLTLRLGGVVVIQFKEL